MFVLRFFSINENYKKKLMDTKLAEWTNQKLNKEIF